MSARLVFTIYGLHIGIYVTLLLVGVLGWMSIHQDWCVTLMLAGVFYYHAVGPFVDMLPVVSPTVYQLPVPPLEETL